MNGKPFSLRKKERLKSRKKLEQVFESGQSFSVGPIRVLWLCTQQEDGSGVQAAFASSKKVHKQATKRNLLKRRMKEAYRKNKHVLTTFLVEKNMICSLVFLYFYKDILNYEDIEKHLVQSIQQLIKRIEKGN
jgi:ribonuclease P protein component